MGLKKGISPNSSIQKGQEWPRGLFLDLSCLFFTVPPLSSLVFLDFGEKREEGCQNLEEQERKEKHSFLFLSRSHFLPFFSSHISIFHSLIIINLICNRQSPTLPPMGTLLQNPQASWCKEIDSIVVNLLDFYNFQFSCPYFFIAYLFFLWAYRSILKKETQEKHHCNATMSCECYDD